LRLANRRGMFPRLTTHSVGSSGAMGAPRRPGGALPAQPRHVEASQEQNGARGRFLDPLLALRHPHPIERRDAAAPVRPLVLIWASPPLRWNGRRGVDCLGGVCHKGGWLSTVLREADCMGSAWHGGASRRVGAPGLR
jgi:hypothetical protein